MLRTSGGPDAGFVMPNLIVFSAAFSSPAAGTAIAAPELSDSENCIVAAPANVTNSAATTSVVDPAMVVIDVDPMLAISNWARFNEFSETHSAFDPVSMRQVLTA